MSKALGLAFFRLAVVALAVAAGAEARADDCKCTGRLERLVNFARPPHEVEGPNKVRINIQPGTDAKTGQPIIDVAGYAFYPDGVQLTIAVRHWKVRDHFSNRKVNVKNRAFTTRLGPFPKKLPGGGIVVEAWFILKEQAEDVKEKLVHDKWLVSTPPCKHDERNLTQVTYSRGFGGPDAEATSEREEKAEIEKARAGLLDAQKVVEGVLVKVEAKTAGADEAVAACTRLEADLKAVADGFNTFAKERQYMLFTAKVQLLKRLSALIQDGAKARAVSLGATIGNVPAAKAGETAQKASQDALKLADELKGFVDETESLDKAWEAFQKERKAGDGK